MKPLIMIVLAFSFLIKLHGQAAINAESRLTAVTVYPEQAQLEYTGVLTLPVGESRVVFTKLSPALLSQSIQLKFAESGIRIDEVSIAANFLSQKKADQRIEALHQQKDSLQEVLDWATHQKEVLKGQESVLNANQQVTSRQVGDVQQWLDYYGKELTRIRRALLENEKASQLNKKALDAILKQINQYYGSYYNKANQEITAVLRTTKAVRVTYRLFAVVAEASWTADYDVHLVALDAPLHVRFKANIQQSTGENWDNVKLLISTAQPASDNRHPVPEPEYARIRNLSGIDTVVTFDPETYQESVQVVRNDLNLSEEEWSDKTFAFTSSTYTLTESRSVPSDGDDHAFTVREFPIPAKIIHYAAPRISPHVYLIAEIINNSEYDLRMGTAKVYNENALVGWVPLNVESTADTLQISLGIDQDVFLKRERRDFGASQWLGAYRQETFDFAISLRNNKTTPIEVKLLDQIPISTDKQIEISLLKKDNAVYNEARGELEWKVRCAPGNTETRSFSYRIKYPKDEIVDGKW